MIYTTAAFSAMIFTSLKDMVSKRLAGSVDGTVSTLASFAYTIPYYSASLLVAILLGFPLGDIGVSFWILVGLRSSTDALAEWLKMTALGHADISLVSPFFALSPVILLILGPVFTGDHITIWGGVGVLLTVLGTIGLFLKRGESKGGNGAGSLRGILMALGASVFFALNSLFDRLAVQQASVLVSAAAMTAAATVPFIIPVCRSSERRLAFFAHSRLFHLRAILEVLFMTLKLFALCSLPSAYVTGLFRMAAIILILAGKFVFKEQEIGQRLIWGSVIVAGSLLIVFSG